METVAWEQQSFEVERKNLLHLSVYSHVARQLCIHGWLGLCPCSEAACPAYDRPSETRPGCKMDGDNGVLVVSCLLLLCKREQYTVEGTCLNTAPARWYNGAQIHK